MDVAVVGGGITGLFAAYYLRKEGAEVTIFERAELGGDSIHAAGILEPENFYRTNNLAYLRRAWRYLANGSSIFRSIDPGWFAGYATHMGCEPATEGWEKLHSMAALSIAEYNGLAEERNDFELTMGGLEEHYEDGAAFRSAVTASKAKHPPVKFEVRERPGLAGVLFFPRMGWLHTELFIRRMRSELEGVRIVRGEVQSLSGDGTVVANGEGKAFDSIVASMGVACRRMGLPLTSVKGYGWHAIATGQVTVATIYADRGIAAVPLAPFATGKQSATGGTHLKVTGGWDFDLSLDTSHSTAILANAARLAGIEQVLDFRSGQRPCSPDGLPVVGRGGRLVAATGGFRLGWSFAPGIGHEAAKLALGQAKNDPFLSRYCDGMRTDAIRLA